MRPPKRKPTVWILGAGFSRSLGGPLLKDFLSPRAFTELSEEFKEVRYEGGLKTRADETDLWKHARIVFEIFASGTANLLEWRAAINNHNPTPGFAGARDWDDAEHFLDFLDGAADRPSSVVRLDAVLKRARMGLTTAGNRPVGDHQIRGLHHIAQRLLAAQCCQFMRELPTSERWQPYLDWAKQLGSSDTVITFNYDLVVETASWWAGRPVFLLGMHGLQSASNDRAVLIKLHGSVDWEATPNESGFPYSVSRDPEYSVAAPPGTNLSIATPGRTKRGQVSGGLAELWRVAVEKISQAANIVFLGYRFPPSDAGARETLLGAIMKNTADDVAPNARLRVHTVLGNDQDGVNAARRLEALLNHSCQRAKRVPIPHLPSYEVTVHPLFVEDFLTVFDPAQF